MVIERDSDTITFKVDASLVDMDTVQKVADYFKTLESNAQNLGTQEQADELARESHSTWLKDNRERINNL
ncbi:MAG: hypothetical protein V4619_07105 [Bacteroidota bacterium]